MKYFIFFCALFFIEGCSALNDKAYIIYAVHNDTGRDLYEPEMINEKGELVFRIYGGNMPYEDGSHNGLTQDVLGVPEYLRVRWKEYLDGEWIERKVDVKSAVPKGFWGDIYVSVLSVNEVELSWIMQYKHAYGIGTKDCGGYIFEHYYDEETKATIEKKMLKLNAYTVQKEKDIKAGLGDKYKTPKYYDTVEEADYRCNIYFYL
ncbi:hypothetical protein [uncultured Zhongshania sp.]|uniref:hypothetical protein n=1 Tax=uncultured Zhongshania sp. TaxID=1642288 RepID=UPI0030DD2BF3|tara:strand:+ start:1482 stop:2096 length:615 start_codon:yes stop_codon:yes gene_type:complete